MRHTIITLLSLLTTTAQAQQPNLNDPALNGVELDFIKLAAANRVGVYADLTYWNFLAVRYHGWNGGDGTHSTTLPDGRTFWSFGSSHFGLVSENRQRKAALNNRPHNAAMIQVGEETEDDFITLNAYASTSLADPDAYYKGREWLRHPDSKLSEEEEAQGVIDNDVYFEPNDATLIKYAGKPRLQVLVGGYTSSGRTENAVAEYTLDGDPGDAEYMQLKTLHRNVAPYTTDYGHSMLEDEGHVYLYGRIETGTNLKGYYPVVARTQSLNLCSPWEYYICTEDGNWQWQQQPPTKEEMQRSGIISSVVRMSSYSVFRYNDKYYLCYIADNNRTLWIATADDPFGPFKQRKTVYDIQEELKNATRLTVHPQLSRTGELVVSYNVDPVDITVVSKGDNDMAVETLISGDERNFYDWTSADLDQTHFLRLFNWQALFGVSNTGPLEDANMLAYDATAIDDVTTDHAATTALQGIYDLQGRRLNKEPEHGIFIRNGKKIIK